MDASQAQPISFAQQKGFECARAVSMAEAFADYHRARGSRMVDWSAAWRTWVKREIDLDIKAIPEPKQRAW